MCMCLAKRKNFNEEGEKKEPHIICFGASVRIQGHNTYATKPTQQKKEKVRTLHSIFLLNCVPKFRFSFDQIVRSLRANDLLV